MYKIIALVSALIFAILLSACKSGADFNNSVPTWDYNSNSTTTENTLGGFVESENGLQNSGDSNTISTNNNSQAIYSYENPTSNNEHSTTSKNTNINPLTSSKENNNKNESNSSHKWPSTNNSDSTNNTESGENSDNGNIPTPEECTYEQYLKMSSDDQHAFFRSFKSVEKFFEWYKVAKKEYKDAHPDIEIGDGPINIGKNTG